MKKQKKWMKNVLALLMAGIMLFGMAVTTFAAGEATGTKGTVTINNTVAGKDLTYYQIFSATKNGTAVAYKLNSNYEGFFKSEAKYGCTELSGEALSQAAYKYVSGQTTAEAKKLLSQELLEWTLKNSVQGTEVKTTASPTIVQNVLYGFYLFNFAGATSVNGVDGAVKTPAMLVNVTNSTVPINMKSSYPVVDKTVDHQSAAIGGTVTYTLTSHVPDMTGYESYTFKFKDTLSTGLTFGKITEVKIGETVLQSDTGYTLTAEGQEITVDFKNFIQYKAQTGASVVVEYTATVNEKAVVGMNPNTNEATVEYSNDPKNPNNGVPSVSDIVDVHTFDFTVNKYFMKDQIQTSLSGVGFKLYSDQDCNAEVKVVQESAGDDRNAAVYRIATGDAAGDEAITPVSGKIQFKGLDAETYYLKETTTPDGYNSLTGPITIQIIPEYQDGKLTKYEVSYIYDGKTGKAESNRADNSPTIDVENKSGTELPETGGVGAIIFTVVGVAILAVVMISSMVSKKRKNS